MLLLCGLLSVFGVLLAPQPPPVLSTTVYLLLLLLLLLMQLWAGKSDPCIELKIARTSVAVLCSAGKPHLSQALPSCLIHLSQLTPQQY